MLGDQLLYPHPQMSQILITGDICLPWRDVCPKFRYWASLNTMTRLKCESENKNLFLSLENYVLKGIAKGLGQY